MATISSQPQSNCGCVIVSKYEKKPIVCKNFARWNYICRSQGGMTSIGPKLARHDVQQNRYYNKGKALLHFYTEWDIADIRPTVERHTL